MGHSANTANTASTADAGFGVLFDVGYTLLDESDRLAAAIAWVAERMDGVDAKRLDAAYRAACAAPAPNEPSLFVQTMMGLGLNREDAKSMRKALPWDAVPMTPYPDTKQALERLTQLPGAGVRVGVLANQPASAADDLERAGLTPYFDGVWLSEPCGLSKPDPAFFRLALDAWGLPPARVAYVGDRPDNDVAPAKAIGMKTVLIRQGPHAVQAVKDAAETPDAEAGSLTEIAEHMRSWSGSR